MIAQVRPDLARVAEETVVNLKNLETSIEVLRNDLAWLCQTIGHPQAAQLALTPVRTSTLAYATPGIPTFSGALPISYLGLPTGPMAAGFLGVPSTAFGVPALSGAAAQLVPSFATNPFSGLGAVPFSIPYR